MGFNKDGLSQYVKENEGIILKDIVFGNAYGYTIPVMAKQLGIKTSERIHPSTVDAVLQDVTGCGFNAQGDLTFTERVINTHQKKVNMQFCAEDLLGKFAEYKVRVGADADALPFEAEILEGVIKSIAKKAEALVWEDLRNAEGLNWETINAADTYGLIVETYKKMKEEVLEDGIIFVSPSVFRNYVLDLVNKNLYHYNPADGDLTEIFIPGANVKVRKAIGMPDNNIFATSPKNMIYGTDFMSNTEEIKVWYSDDDDVYKLKARFNLGANVAFPDLVTAVIISEE